MSPSQREYNVPSGRDVWKNQLIETFPEEKEAIENFFQMVRKASRSTKSWVMVKVLPIWLVKVMSFIGLSRWFSDFFSLGSHTLQDIVEVI